MFVLSLFHSSSKCYRMLQKFSPFPKLVHLNWWWRKSILCRVFYSPSWMRRHHELPPRAPKLNFVLLGLMEWLHYEGNRDVIEGTEDHGDLGKTQYVANHAGVFMIRGQVEKWKQPVGYILRNGPMSSYALKYCLLTCVKKYQAAGMLVKPVICDQWPLLLTWFNFNPSMDK